MPPLLTIENVTKRFGGLEAVKNVSATVEEGEILGLIGPNGAGKTTLFNTIAGVFRPEAGTIHFRNEAITDLPPHEVCLRGISRTFQKVRPFSGMTTLDNVIVGAYSKLDDRAEAEEVARECLDYVGLSKSANIKAENMTFVAQKTIELARCLATKPKLLMLDEFVAGLNAKEISDTLPLIRQLRDDGITLFIVEHVMKAIMPLSDRLIVLDSGQLIAEGPPEEVAKDETVIKAYLGESYVHVATG